MQLTDIKINLPSQNIDERVENYLLGIGDNKELAQGLKIVKRYWLGPLLLPLNILERCCGPEENMEFKLTQFSFDETVNKVINYIKNGNTMEPMICQYKDGKISIRDGNHRHEAIKRLNIPSYRVLIWTDTQEEYDQCVEYIMDF